MTDSDPLAVIEAAIPVSADDGCTIVGASHYDRNGGHVVMGATGNYPPQLAGEYSNPLYGHPSIVAALVRDALDKAGLLLTDQRIRAIVAERGLHELCWQQDKPGAGTACDRIIGHGGRHTWETLSAKHAGDAYDHGWNDCAEDIGNDLEVLAQTAEAMEAKARTVGGKAAALVMASALKIARDHMNPKGGANG